MPLFSELNKIVYGLAPQDITNTTGRTDIVNVGRYGHCAIVLGIGDMGTAQTIALTLEECTSTTASSTQGTARTFNYRTVGGALGTTEPCDVLGTLTASTSLTISTTEDNKFLVIEIDNKELTDGYPYVKAVITPSSSTSLLVTSFAILSEPRYGGDVPLTAIA